MKMWTLSGKKRAVLAAAALVLLAACGNPNGTAAPIPGLPQGTVIPDGGLCGGVPANGQIGTAVFSANIIDQYNRSGNIGLNLYPTSGTPNYQTNTQSIVSNGRVTLPNRNSNTGFSYCLSTTDYQSGQSGPGKMMSVGGASYYGQQRTAAIQLLLSALVKVNTYKNGAPYVPYPTAPYTNGGYGQPYNPTQLATLNVGRLEARVGTQGTCDVFVNADSYTLAGCVHLIIPYLDGDENLYTSTGNMQ